MPRAKDIGWQHGTMVGEHRHHVKCNYCHRTMIGGVTRFKKHLASTKGEIKGCEAVPKEVRELIEEHLATRKMRKPVEKKRKTVDPETVREHSSEDKHTESDQGMTNVKLETLKTLHDSEETCQLKTNDPQQPAVETREIVDTLSVVLHKNEQGLAPPRATDPGWAHGKMINEDRQKIKCIYCDKVILGGGISRLKQHLAGYRGNIAPCENVPEDVRAKMQQHLGSNGLERQKKQNKLEDTGWAHGTENGSGEKTKCEWCNRVIDEGGVSTLKQHLAGLNGNIPPCENVPKDVREKLLQSLSCRGRPKKQKAIKITDTLIPSLQGMAEESSGTLDMSPKVMQTRANSGRSNSKKIKEETRSKKSKQTEELILVATPITQRPLHLTSASKESIDEADRAVAKFVYDAGLPFSAANSLYFQQMADSIAAAGPGYKMPSYQSLRGMLLDESVKEAGGLCEELRKSWEVTGCSVMADRSKDRTGCLVVRIFVYCSKGTMFLKAFDASLISESPLALLDLFDTVVQDVGPKNIVNFVTDTTPNFKAAANMLVDRYKTFFWSACAVQCIDLMLEELGEIENVREIFVKAKRISQFIYNNSWVYNLMKEKIGGGDIVRHSVTRFTTNFLTLENLMCLKEPLHQMFSSKTWIQSSFSNEKGGIDVSEIVLDPLFWTVCDEILMVAKPLLAILKLLDSEERSSMGFIYDAIENARNGIIVAFNNREAECSSYLKVVDHIWEEELHSPLHAAGYYLNPSIFYNPSFSNSKVMRKGLLDCIETLETDPSAQDILIKHMKFYEDAEGSFGKPMARGARDSLAPAAWWSLYAVEYPDLQRFALRILSQTCSVVRPGRNCSSMLDNVHFMHRNRLEGKRLTDIVFVHYNLRLQARQSSASRQGILRDSQDLTCLDLEATDDNAGDWIQDPSITLCR
ncbi:uncharacterized protein LOC113348074 [Papaver somniferum]|uniref:uncharacterized protein LOC113348074 n=1 Tax=Papaver somniferum TaxID=3469 RepID=UPI000E6FA333|nr:uncharacterized protein LOC113348074 [Papaver somniferum]XP_026447560.1 uncharacterized protein LOC113348074 [Papaver somniferum]